MDARLQPRRRRVAPPPQLAADAYWRQQRGYGRAEALLERKWPEKYNAPGHLAWSGRLYGRGCDLAPPRRWRVYYGTWGSAPFQQLYRPADGTLASLPLMPEWYLVIAALAAVSAAGGRLAAAARWPCPSSPRAWRRS